MSEMMRETLTNNLNNSLSHQTLDDGPIDLEWLLRTMVGYQPKWGYGFSTSETYAEMHVQEAIIQLQYAVLALENR